MEDNAGYLQQAMDLLRSLSDELYVKAVPQAFNTGVGQHLRHCLDHYERFLAGLQSGKIDYDARDRDPRVETDRQYALSRIETIVAALRRIAAEDGDRAVQVKQASSASQEAASTWSASSVPRELQFLVSHTVHHYALIAMILRLLGLEPHSDFGVAPSTLKYRQTAGS